MNRRTNIGICSTVLLLLALSSCQAPPAAQAPTAVPSPQPSAITKPTIKPTTEANTEANTEATAVPQQQPTGVPEATPVPPTELPVVEAAAAQAALYQGIPHGYTAEGFPYLGDANAAVTLTDYSDFL
jgi:hypothetical protein